MIKFHISMASADSKSSSRKKEHQASSFFFSLRAMNFKVKQTRIWNWRTDNALKGIGKTKVEVTKVAVRHETALGTRRDRESTEKQ